MASDLFVFPTVYEGSPFALLEAMSYGLPVVTTDASGIAEVVRNGQDGIVVPAGNSLGLLNGIRTALVDMEYMRALSLSALERVKDFSADKMAEQTLGLLEEVGSSRR